MVGVRMIPEDSLGEKEKIEDAVSQQHKFIHQMEQTCYSQIRGAEEKATTERAHRKDFQKNIFTCRQSPENLEEVFKKILEKSIYDKARDKMKAGAKKEEADSTETQKKDFLDPILEKLGY